MDRFLEAYGRVNGLLSPEERPATKEQHKTHWEEEKEPSFMIEVGIENNEPVPPHKLPPLTTCGCLPFCACRNPRLE